jgi:molecular chaperone IbpA
MRTAYDFSPLYRSMIGIDRTAALIDNAMGIEADRAFPPYDVEKTAEDGYRISLAAAGFGVDDLEITAQPNLLIVTGRRARDERERVYLHQGIAGRHFERKFELADYVVVKSAAYENGVLSIDLAREAPEALKPRRIEISGGEPTANLRRIGTEPAQRRAA